MTTRIEQRAYCWIEQNGGWQVGKPLLTNDEECVCRHTNSFEIDSEIWSEQILMQPSHAGKPTWVPVSELEPYPLEPIEDPSVKGGE